MRYQIQKLGVGGILDQSINVMKDNFGLLFSIYAVTLLPLTLAFNFLQLWFGIDPKSAMAQPETMSAGLTMLAILPLFIIAGPVWNAATIHGIASVYVSRPTTLGECIKTGFRRLFPLIWTGILTTLAIIGGFFLLIIGMFIFAFWFSLAQEVVVIEGTSGTAAMGRSKRLMKGNIMKLFVVSLVVGAVNFGLGMVGGLFGQSLVAVLFQAVIGGVTQMLGSAVLVVFYFSARCEHENFDLQMLASSVEEDAVAAR